MGNKCVTHFFSYYIYTRTHSDMALAHSKSICTNSCIIIPIHMQCLRDCVLWHRIKCKPCIHIYFFLLFLALVCLISSKCSLIKSIPFSNTPIQLKLPSLYIANIPLPFLLTSVRVLCKYPFSLR